MFKETVKILAVCAAMAFAACAEAGEMRKKALVVMLDGCRADAVKCGTYVSLYGGRVHMDYGACSHGTGDVTFTVTPMNCFGARGKSLATTFKA